MMNEYISMMDGGWMDDTDGMYCKSFIYNNNERKVTKEEENRENATVYQKMCE